MKHNPNLGYAACVSRVFIIHTPVLKIVADGEGGVVSGMIRFPFAMYNEKLQKRANIPRAHRVENELEEFTGGKNTITKTITLN